MIDINELRRLAQGATPGPWKMLPVGDGRQKFAVADSEFLSILTVTDEGGATFGTVYDDADARFIAAANPAAITEILDRLEEAESDALEQARLNGMGSEREAALMARLEAAEKELAELRSSMKFRTSLIGRTEAERDVLRAKVERMEQQEPVLWQVRTRPTWNATGWSEWRDCCEEHAKDVTKAPMLHDWLYEARVLYALPGAKGE